MSACGPLTPTKHLQQQSAIKLEDLVNLECEDDKQCLTLPYGHKACGGPSHHLIYSNLKTNEEALKIQAQKITEEEKANSNGPSTCDVPLAPAVACVQSICQKIGDSPYTPNYPNMLGLERYSETQPKGCKDFTLYWLSNKGSQHLIIKGNSKKLGIDSDDEGSKMWGFSAEKTFDIEKLNQEPDKRLEIAIENMDDVHFIKEPSCDEVLTRGIVKHEWKAVKGNIIIKRVETDPQENTPVIVSVKLLHVEFKDNKGRFIYLPEWNLNNVTTITPPKLGGPCPVN